MTVIRDPLTGDGVRVTKDGHATVVAITETGFEHASEEEGLAFSWVSSFGALAGEETISIQNDDNDRHLHISHVEYGNDLATLLTFFEVTSGTPGGTSITAQNLNLASGKVAEETAFGNLAVTGSLSGNNLGLGYVPASQSVRFDWLSGLILAKDDKFAITQGSSGICAVTVYGFYSEEPA